MMLADGAIGQMMEKVVFSPQKPRRTEEQIIAQCGSWAACGKGHRDSRNVVTSLFLQADELEGLNNRLQEKYREIEAREVRYEEFMCDDAEYVLVAFGLSARICSAVVEMARAEGIKLGLLRPITLYPFPTARLRQLAERGVKGFMTVELNSGQMVEDVRLAVEGRTPVEHYGRTGGVIYNPDSVFEAFKQKLLK
jgi:2-oxoglutarate ferredoxin oxidoreductase subunit alpha